MIDHATSGTTAARPFLVIGECVADIVRPTGEPDHAHPGGSPANVAYGLARLGHPTTLLTQLGPDDIGAMIRSHLASAGVEILADDPERVRTPSAVVDLDGEGRASYAFDISWTLRPTVLAALPRHVHIGSIAAVMPPGAATVLEHVERLRKRASISYDPNVRPQLFGPRTEAVVQVERYVALSDIVKVSDEDLNWLYPERPVDDVMAQWLGAGPALVLVTRGGDGSLGRTRQERGAAAAPPVTVVDTVGAGDSFMSGALDALAALGVLGAEHRTALGALSGLALARVLATAGSAAAITVSRAGANPPDAAELRAVTGT